MSDNVSKLIKFHDLLGLDLTVFTLSLEENTFFFLEYFPTIRHLSSKFLLFQTRKISDFLRIQG